MACKPTAKQIEKAIEARINKAYHATCQGIEINIMDISKVSKVGRECIDAGQAGENDEGLRTKIKAFVETIKC